MSNSPPPGDTKQVVERVEEQRRFQRLRALIFNPKLRHRLIILFSVAALVTVAVLAFFAYTAKEIIFDLDTTREFQQFDSALFLDLMILVTKIGYPPWSVITVVGGVLLLGVLLGWKEGAYLLGVTLFQGLINTLLKNLIDRPRPIEDLVTVFLPSAGFSFPSGHVMFYTVFFGFLFFVAWARFPRSILRGIALFLTAALVLLVGPSRIYLGAHWITDVIAAYLISIVILSVAIEVYLHYVAPPAAVLEGGLIGHHDRMLEQES